MHQGEESTEIFFSVTIKLMELINGIVTLTLSDSLVPLKSAVSFWLLQP